MTSLLRTVAALPSAERRVLLEAVAVTAFFSCALRVLPFRMVRLLSRPAARRRGDGVSVERIAALVDAAGRRTGAACLGRALALGRLLAARGIPHEIHVGARRVERGLAAHAWVSHAGRVLMGGNSSQLYEPLVVLNGGVS